MTGTHLALLLLGFWLSAAIVVARGNRRMRRLTALAAPAPATWPRVSLVFAARNEGSTLGRAVPTMLAVDYPDLEIIAVNDRSEDNTGTVLDAIAARDPRLKVIHLRELPADWIGKNHALHQGAAIATGRWILFTDADIHFGRDAVRRAVACVEAEGIDLLAAVPSMHEHGTLLGGCVNAFSFTFTIGIQPWRIPNPRAAAHASVGAFGLARATKYRELGGHAPIRLRPDDDVKLGKLFKKNGARCELLHGHGGIAVQWYDSTAAMIRGLTKNAYAGADYRWWLPPFAAVAQAVLFYGPFAALWLTTGVAQIACLASIVLMLGLGVDQTRFTGGRAVHGLLLPIGITIFSYILLRSMFVTHWTSGITWRGTHYPLAALKANRL